MALETAIVLANNAFRSEGGKTAHGLLRCSKKFKIVGVIDPDCAGNDSGLLLDGAHNGIQIYSSISQAIDNLESVPKYCIVGVSVVGGRLTSAVRMALKDAMKHRISVVNVLHELITNDIEIVALAKKHDVSLEDARLPKDSSQLRYWTGHIRTLKVPRIAVLGTDVMVGKRTTATLLAQLCNQHRLRAELIYTGHTGWLQGYAKYGVILDSTLNDFVAGELERAIVDCCSNERPDLVIIEGQSSLLNPSGPGGGVLILSCGAKGVILQHKLARKYYAGFEKLRIELPRIDRTIALLHEYGATILGVTINAEGAHADEIKRFRNYIFSTYGLLAVDPLRDDLDSLFKIVATYIDTY